MLHIPALLLLHAIPFEEPGSIPTFLVFMLVVGAGLYALERHVWRRYGAKGLLLMVLGTSLGLAAWAGLAMGKPSFTREILPVILGLLGGPAVVLHLRLSRDAERRGLREMLLGAVGCLVGLALAVASVELLG